MGRYFYHKILEILPEPCKFSKDDRNKFWVKYLDILEDLLSKRKFDEITNLFLMSIDPCTYASSGLDKDIKNRFITVFYDIITKKPIDSYGVVFNAAAILERFLVYNSPKGIILQWRPLYDLFIHIFESSPNSIILYNIDIAKSLVNIADRFCDCWPKGTAKELFDLLLPKISPHGLNTGVYVTILSYFYPKDDPDFEQWLPTIVTLLNGAGSMWQAKYLLHLVNKIIVNHIEHDFSVLLDPVVSYISEYVLNDSPPSNIGCEINKTTMTDPTTDEMISSSSAKILALLVTSPPTRKVATQKYLFILNSMLNIIKDSGPNDTYTSKFINATALAFLRTKRKVNKQVYPKDVDFSQEEIDALFEPIVDIIICLLMSANFTQTNALIKAVRITLNMSTKFSKRIFEFSLQCISHADAPSVGNIGWNLMSAVILQAPKFDFLRDSLVEILQDAISNYYRTDIQFALAQTLYAISTTIVFNTEHPVEGFEKIDYPSLVLDFSNAYFDAIQRLPAYEGKQVNEDSQIVDLLHSIFYNVFSAASDDVFEKVFPVITSVLSDGAYSHVCTYVELYAHKFFFFSPQERWERARKIISGVMQSTNDIYTLIYTMKIYSALNSIRIESKEQAKAKAQEFLKFTKHTSKKVQKEAWKAISCTLRSSSYYSLKIEAPGPATGFYDVSQFKVSEIRKTVDNSDIEAELFSDLFNTLLNETDPAIILSTAKPALKGLLEYFISDVFVSEADEAQIPEIYKLSYFDYKPFISKHHPTKEKFIQCIIRILRDFPDCPTLIQKIINGSELLFQPMSAIKNSSQDYTEQINNFLFQCERFGKVANLSMVAPAVFSMRQKRMSTHPVPYTKQIREYFNLIIQNATSRYGPVRHNVAYVLHYIGEFYTKAFEDFIVEVVSRSDEIPTDEFIDFTIMLSVFKIVGNTPKLLCDVIYRVLKKFDVKDQVSIHKFRAFLTSNGTNPSLYGKDETEPFKDLLVKIKGLLETTSSPHKIFHYIILISINIALKAGIKLDSFFMKYIFEQGVSCDTELCAYAHICILVALRSTPFKVVKKELTYKPKLEEFIDPIKSCQLIFDEKYPFNKNAHAQEQPQEAEAAPNIDVDELKKMLKEQGVPDEMLEEAVKQIMEASLAMDMQMEEEDGKLPEEQIEGLCKETEGAPKEGNEGKGEEDFCEEEEIDLSKLTDQEILESLSKEMEEQEQPAEVSNAEIANILAAIDHMEIKWDDPKVLPIFESQSAGWYMYPDYYYYNVYEEKDIGLTQEEIAHYMIDFCKLDRNDNYISTSFMETLVPLTPFLTKEIVEIVADEIRKILLQPLTAKITAALIKLVAGVSAGAFDMDFEAYKLFCKKVSIPVICVTALSPQYTEDIDEVLNSLVFRSIPQYCAPIIKIAFELSNNLPGESTVITRTMFSHLNTIFFTRPTALFSAFDELTEKIVSPFFNGIASFPRSINGEFICNFVNLVESTCITEKSPLYSPLLKEKRDKLISEFEKSLMSVDIHNKCVQGVIIAFLSYTSTASISAAAALAPIIMKHLKIILQAGNSTDEQTEMLIFLTICEFTMHPLFLLDSQSLVEYIEIMFRYLTSLSYPLQEKLITNLFLLITTNTLGFTKMQMHHLFDIIYSFVEGCKNENVKFTATIILGRTIFQMDEPIELNEITAASVINAACLFDEPEQIVIDALNVVKDILDKSSITRKSFLVRIITQFWKRHSEQVTSKVEKALEPFMTLAPPSYIV